MRWPALTSMLLAGCVRLDPATEMVMDQIERSVSMPDGGHPLDAYGRHYAWAAPSRVEAIYLLPYEAPEWLGCSTIDENFELTPCSPEEEREGQEMEEQLEAQSLPAGQRRWLDRRDSLPWISDGGCMQVTIEYDVAADRFLRVECNGEA